VVDVGDDAEIARVCDGHEKRANIRERCRGVNAWVVRSRGLLLVI
jgi:hypothetical protein